MKPINMGMILAAATLLAFLVLGATGFYDPAPKTLPLPLPAWAPSHAWNEQFSGDTFSPFKGRFVHREHRRRN